jgi:ABC-type dipeptide/oligopeptide/nickel transport system permease subunit
LNDAVLTGLQAMPKGRSLWSDAMKRLFAEKAALISGAVILTYVAIALFVYAGELGARYFKLDIPILKYNEKVGGNYEAPTWKNPLGTDYKGCSVLRKTFYGAKISMTVAFFASIISIIIGVPLGAMAGYFSGFVDEVIVWLFSTLSSIPGILLVLAFALVLKDRSVTLPWFTGPVTFELAGITSVYLALGLTSWVGICRLIRGEVMKHKEREYVLAARSYGCGNGRIIRKHIIPNVFHIVIINFSLQFVSFIQIEVILSFLGLGEKNRPSWGVMIDDARLTLTRGFWWEMAAATVAIFIISLALNIFGDRLRDALDPKLRTQ